MYEIRVTVKSLENHAAIRYEIIPFASWWAARYQAVEYCGCSDVAAVTITEKATGKILFHWFEK